MCGIIARTSTCHDRVKYDAVKMDVPTNAKRASRSCFVYMFPLFFSHVLRLDKEMEEERAPPRQPAPRQPPPRQPPPRQPAPRQPAPPQPTPRQPSPRQPSPTQPAPPQPSPRQPSPTQPSPGPEERSSPSAHGQENERTEQDRKAVRHPFYIGVRTSRAEVVGLVSKQLCWAKVQPGASIGTGGGPPDGECLGAQRAQNNQNSQPFCMHTLHQRRQIVEYPTATSLLFVASDTLYFSSTRRRRIERRVASKQGKSGRWRR